MPLPPLNLDDLKFQQIVDHAKKLIPDYCPEWTDHNVSDPGVTLIELFASMTEMLLYRVNQVPEKVHRTLLGLIGVQLAEPTAAFADITFYLSAPASAATPPIKEGAEIATLRTENRPAIIFTTEEKLEFRPPHLKAIATTAHGTIYPQNAGFFTEDLPVFDAQPRPGNMLYLGFVEDHSDTVIEIEIVCDTSRTYGLDTAKPRPWQWEVWSAGSIEWAKCVEEEDGTGGFTWNGRVRLRLPRMRSHAEFGVEAYWLRLALTEEQEQGPNRYGASPILKGIRAYTVGATVRARHAITVEQEELGISDGTRDQVFRLRHRPLLARNPTTDHLIVFNGQEEQHWTEVADFGDSRPDDQHYTLDSQAATLRFGPVLPLPDGGVARFGAVPPMGSRLIFSRYQYGGGKEGDVAAQEISVLKSSLPFVRRVVNWHAGRGGADSEDIELAKLRAPALLRTRNRAVTRADFEHLTYAASAQIGRAYCLAPGVVILAAGTDDELPQPGQVVMLVLPAIRDSARYIDPAELKLPDYLLNEVQQYLEERAVLGVSVTVRGPALVPVKVQVQIQVAPGVAVEQMQNQVAQRLYRYLSPYTGGAHGQGWAPGVPVSAVEIAALLQLLPGVRRVSDLHLFSAPSETPMPEIKPQAGHIICSAEHKILLES